MRSDRKNKNSVFSLMVLTFVQLLLLTGCSMGFKASTDLLEGNTDQGSKEPPPAKTEQYYLKSNLSQLCMNAEGAPVTGAKIIQGACGPSSLKFEQITANGNRFQLNFIGTDLCLELANASSALDAVVVLGACAKNANHQIFEKLSSMNNSFRLRVLHSGQCLNIKDSLMDEGAELQQWNCGIGSNQFFQSLKEL